MREISEEETVVLICLPYETIPFEVEGITVGFWNVCRLFNEDLCFEEDVRFFAWMNIVYSKAVTKLWL